MHCYECSQAGKNSEAVGICHHCSAALCSVHAHSITDPVTASYPLAMKIILPLQARLILCATCESALYQKREPVHAEAR
jgi:hypothetical protein